MRRVRHFLFIFYYVCFLAWLALLLVPYGISFLFRKDRTFVHWVAIIWARHFVGLAGGRVTVKGLENVPDAKRLCVVANHQGGFDILLISGWFPRLLGFIAKKELGAIPIMNVWMKHGNRCVFIDRKNIRQGIKAIEAGVQSIRDGNAMVIFPEGTRSRGGPMIEFKPGALKLATKADAVVVPVTVNGAWRLYEERGSFDFFLFQKQELTMTIHPPIDTSTLSLDERKALAGRLHDIIRSALPAEA